MTWKEMQDFCNMLPEEELQKNVILWREDESITNISAEQLEEDHYIDPQGDPDFGCFPESEGKKMVEDDDSYPDGMGELKKVYDKGHPILWEKF